MHRWIVYSNINKMYSIYKIDWVDFHYAVFVKVFVMPFNTHMFVSELGRDEVSIQIATDDSCTCLQ